VADHRRPHLSPTDNAAAVRRRAVLCALDKLPDASLSSA